MEQVKTPKKKNSTLKKSATASNVPASIPKFALTPIQDTSVASSPSSGITNLDLIVQQLSPTPSVLRDSLLKLAAGIPLPDKQYPAILYSPGTVEGHSDSHSSSLSRSETLYNEFNFKKQQFFASMGKKTSPFKVYSPVTPAVAAAVSSPPVIEFPQDDTNLSTNSSDSVLVLNTQPEDYAILDRSALQKIMFLLSRKPNKVQLHCSLLLHYILKTHLFLLRKY